ncbi:hypothetical protein [Gordonia alkaliphila]|uniref:Transmembrane protein n=1 Tax=Gordonia alkaliphila TaxID=1053547 RepID=A0ABP8YV79_9ACTN
MTDERAPAISRVALGAIVLIVAQLVVRVVLVARGDFYWDDLIIIGRASSSPILSWEYLGHSHDGHFMPGAFLLAGITTVLAPLQWWLPALTLVLLQLLASLAVWRMIRIVVGRSARAGIGALVALGFYLFVPMTVSAYVWWAAGLNTLPMQAAMAFIVGNAVLLVRENDDPRRRRNLVIASVIAFVVALTFFEKSLFILPVAAVAALLVVRMQPGVGTGDYRSSALTVTFTRARALWAWLSGVFVVWVVIFLSVSTATAGSHSLGQMWKLVSRSLNSAIVPSTVGGPWEWDRWIPSPPMGFPAVWMIVAGWVLIAGAAVWAWQTRRGAVSIVVCAALYAVAAQLPVMWNRSSEATALELAQTMRYLPDTALVFALAMALVAASPARGAHGAPAAPHPAARAGVLAGAVVILVSALVSTAAFSTSWQRDPTGAYLATAQASLAEHSDLVMFDQALPLEVLTPVAYPNNQISRVFGRLDDRPRFGDHTDKLMVLDEKGSMVPGGVSPMREVAPSEGTCADPGLTERTRLALSGPLIEWRWTVSLSYCANRDGEIGVSLGGRELRVPVRAGLHPVYFQLGGHGEHLTVRPLTDGLALHTGAGRVGEPIVAAYAP